MRLDSESAAKVTHASALIEGGTSATSSTTAAVASLLGQSVPALQYRDLALLLEPFFYEEREGWPPFTQDFMRRWLRRCCQ